MAIDPADASGNTVYIGGAEGGLWKSTNGATPVASNVSWIPVTDDQATLSIGALVIQPGNSDPTKSVVLAGTGEANSSADSYFGLGILRSADGGNTWTLISAAGSSSGTVSFSGLGAARMAFSTATGQTNTVVAAMGATAEGETENALTSNVYRGLYTSTDAGQTWTYDTLFSGGAGEATSATSVVYNAVAGLFFAALRYHGFYSSPDGVTWTRLINQPGAAGLLSTTACPQNFAATCPIYRGEITVVPGRNEMYTWFIALDTNNNPVDQGIWESGNGGASWTQISDTGIVNCGDVDGCGVDQGYYNLELLAFQNGATATDLYAGAINLYKCALNTTNSSCSSAPFLNLTHAYGCDPLGAPAHVHPDQHALASLISPSGTALMYFANDGGIYRALDGYTGLATGSCSGANQFDDLNQNLGSMTQFVSFSEHTTNPDILFGGTQDNGSPATATATTNSSWENILSGDGGYSAIDSSTGNWFASNPDFPPASGSLNIQECASGVTCNDVQFQVIVNSGDVGGDDGSFYFPYILDPQSATSLLVGTCRVWRGSRSGGAFNALSLNFETFGTGTCAGTEVNVVRALAAGGPTDAEGSKVIYAVTDGLGPNGALAPSGGHVWVTTNAQSVSGTSSTFIDVTGNGPVGTINPNQFPISAVAIDPSDASGSTAYLTVMGFTGGSGHVWQTVNAGSTWIDFTGTAADALPDSPVNAVLVDPGAHIIYVGTDVGVFQSSSFIAAWTEVGPVPGPLAAGFLPNVAVTSLAFFNSGGQKLLRASTYGRGIWQFNLLATPDFQIGVPDTPITAFLGALASFSGTVTAVNGYNNSVSLSCTAGSSGPPSPCSPSPVTLTPTSRGSAFALSVGTGTIGDYSFNVQGIGSDPNATTHSTPLTLHVVSFGLTTPSPGSITEPRGSTSPPVDFQVTAQGSFDQGVTLSCSFSPGITGAGCSFTPGPVVNPTSSSPVNVSATVAVPAGTNPGSYTVTIQAVTEGAAALTTSFTMTVTVNPDFVISEPNPFPNVKAGSTGTSGPITIASQDGFNGTVSLSCVTTFGSNSCSITPASVNAFPATANLVINGTSFTAGSYQIAVQGVSGSNTHSLPVPFFVGDYQMTGPPTLTSVPGGQISANLTFTSINAYSGQVNATCDATDLPGTQCSLSPANPILIVSGAVVFAIATINIPNDAIPGAYNININSQDVGGTPSHQVTLALTVQSDFALGSLTPPTQTIKAGQSASYNFSVLPVGAAFSDPVNLSCSGAPAASLCTFTPNPATPGNNSAAVVLQVNTSASSARIVPYGWKGTAVFYALWLALPAICVFRSSTRRGSKLRLARSILALFLLGALLTSCGGGGSNGGSGGGGGIGGQQQGTQPGTYTITVTGTSGSLTHNAPGTITLVVTP